jgi:hypothetical protein
MNAETETRMTAGDVVTEAAGWLATLGTVTMVLFPFALPGIVLVVAALVPLLLLAVPLALVAAVVAAPVLAVRGLRRRSEARRAADRQRLAPRAPLGAAPPAGAVR